MCSEAVSSLDISSIVSFTSFLHADNKYNNYVINNNIQLLENVISFAKNTAFDTLKKTVRQLRK